jgi:hypothetical protein
VGSGLDDNLSATAYADVLLLVSKWWVERCRAFGDPCARIERFKVRFDVKLSLIKTIFKNVRCTCDNGAGGSLRKRPDRALLAIAQQRQERRGVAVEQEAESGADIGLYF